MSEGVDVEQGPGAGDAGHRWVYPLLGVGYLLLLALQHLRAYLGDAVYEHLPQMASQFARETTGQGVEEPLLTGGGSLVLWLHGALNEAGYSYVMAHWIHLVCEAVAIGLWLWWAPRCLPRTVVWATALWLVLYEVPKLHLYENSAFVGFAAVPMFAAFLIAQRRAHLGWLVVSAGLLAACAYFSLISLFLIPALWLAVALTFPRRRLFACVLFALTSLGAVLPQVFSSSPDGDGYAHLLFRLQPSMVVGTAIDAAGSTARFLAAPPLLAGLLIAALALRRSSAAGVLLAAALWLAAASLPVPWLDPFDAPYHYLTASPARALLAGAGLIWLLEALPRAAGRPMPAEVGLAAVSGLALAIVGGLSIWDAGIPVGERASRQLEPHCTAWEEDCRHWRIQRVLTDLLEQGLIEEKHPTAFHGVHAECLSGAWNWRLQTRGLAPRPWHFSNVLLLPRLEDPVLLERLGAVQLTDLTAVPHVENVNAEASLAPTGEGDAQRATLSFQLLEGVDLFVGISSRIHFHPGETVASRVGSAPMPELARCDDHHHGWSRRWYDGYRLLDAREGTKTTTSVRIEDLTGETWLPESIDVLAIPAERPAGR